MVSFLFSLFADIHHTPRHSTAFFPAAPCRLRAILSADRVTVVVKSEDHLGQIIRKVHLLSCRNIVFTGCIRAGLALA
jgi:hypothetical protein